jgi:hypothetical protein
MKNPSTMAHFNWPSHTLSPTDDKTATVEESLGAQM